MTKKLEIETSKWPSSLEQGVYSSDVLRRLRAQYRPEQLPICATCPKASWDCTATDLSCWCTLKGDVTWEDGSAPILQCDTREAATHQLTGQLAGWLMQNTPTGQDLLAMQQAGTELPEDAAIPLAEISAALVGFNAALRLAQERQARGG